ncbi:Protein TAR1 [Abeliophyllum distichum]|uniref:Protein TAR1 n=1 Tax=Abeliophyllum distichum TaxID=126358 RepID=A0ABD1NQ66_9LAMI
MVRLVFRPYTQVRRTICTSVSLRASTRVSSGFAPLRHSSPSFGSRQVCSHSNPSQKIKVGRRCTPRGITPISFLAPYGFTHPLTRTHVRLLGPCFKTGRMGSPQASTGSTQMPKHAWEARAVRHNRDDGIPQAYRLPGSLAAASIRAGPRPESIGRPAHRRSTSDRDASPTPIRFPPDNFKHSLTLFSKFFSSFPRGTCSLSVSRLYLALDGIYRPIGAAFPNNPTRRQRLVVRRQGPSTTGLSPSLAPLSRGLGLGPPLRTLLQTTIRTAKPHDFQVGLFPVRSPLLGESL